MRFGTKLTNKIDEAITAASAGWTIGKIQAPTGAYENNPAFRRTYHNPQATRVTTQRQPFAAFDDLFPKEKQGLFDHIATQHHHLCLISLALAKRELVPLWQLDGYQVLCSNREDSDAMPKRMYQKFDIPISWDDWRLNLTFYVT
jgi:hypothetical protein